MTTKLLIRLKSANIMTIKPAVLKNIPFDFSFKPKELKLTRASTGKVPRANASIVRPPFIKLPVDKVKTCIDCVKPQGKKKVAIPIKNGVKV